MTSTLIQQFDLWAEVYDTQINPLLHLEERHLSALLPSVQGSDILDVGTGTGRWLLHLELLAPKSLTGTDPSAIMLEHARNKVAPTTVLHRACAATLPGNQSSQDLILASFVLSYVDDLQTFAAECSRLLRPGGHVLLSDMHPVTAAERGWTRSFKSNAHHVALSPKSHSIPDIIAIFQQQGLDLEILIEPSFDEPERSIFESSAKQSDYDSLQKVPAIYVLRFRSTPVCSAASPLAIDFAQSLINAPWAITPHTWDDSPLSIRSGSITSSRATNNLDLNGYVLLPGLVNAHDHLEFALFPNLGDPPYSNATEWAKDIHQRSAAIIQQHLQIPLRTRLWWGAIRNLLCGATTVCHHNPLHPELLEADLPIRVVSDYSWSHSLNFDPNINNRFHNGSQDQPFILHAAEGIDERSRIEFYELDRHELLTPRTVLVHGLALEHQEVTLLNRRGASLILCPSSNKFLFGRSPHPSLIGQIKRIALGSDSPLTAAGDLLDELKFLSDPYDLVTTSAADILQLKHGEGRIVTGRRADLIAVRNHHASPAQTLRQLTAADIELVLLGGRVQLASETLYVRLMDHQREGLQLLEMAGHKRWVRAPLATLFDEAEQILGKDNLRLGNKEVRYVPTH
ncbi:MAG: putative methyltransferase [Acidobacteriaceae bacterium]|nr:putative methyltransferase [Acidobacteriaceae bacterium]